MVLTSKGRVCGSTADAGLGRPLCMHVPPLTMAMSLPRCEAAMEGSSMCGYTPIDRNIVRISMSTSCPAKNFLSTVL